MNSEFLAYIIMQFKHFSCKTMTENVSKVSKNVYQFLEFIKKSLEKCSIRCRL